MCSSTCINVFMENLGQVYRNEHRFKRRISASCMSFGVLIILAFLNFVVYALTYKSTNKVENDLLGIYLPVILVVLLVSTLAMIVHTLAPVCMQTVRDIQTLNREDSLGCPSSMQEFQTTSTVDNEQPEIQTLDEVDTSQDQPQRNEQATVDEQQPGTSLRIQPAESNIRVNVQSELILTPGMPPVEEPELRSLVSMDSLCETIRLPH